MQSREYLKQAYKLNEKIKDKQERLLSMKELSDCIGATDYSKDKVQTSPKGDAPFVNQVTKIIELEEELQQDLLQMFQLKAEISKAIDAVEDVNCSLVLSKRYILMKTWEQIAEDMNYSVSQIQRIHERALEIFEVPQKDDMK